MSIESGVRKTLRQQQIEAPSTALEMLAIQLAQALDGKPDERTIAAISRELRLTLDAIRAQPGPVEGDPVAALAAKY